MRVPAEDIKQVATVIDGIEYRAKGGFFEMPDGDAKIHLQSANMPSSWQAFRGAHRRSTGFRCRTCGFGSFFRRCSRCGTDTCEREGAHASAA
jgi:hypothetical protein